MKSRFHELAASELAEAVAHYDSTTEGLGTRLLAEMRAAVMHIESFPDSSPVIAHAVRRKVLAKFPYDVFYTLEENGVIILSIAHERRRPGFWQSRMR